MHRACGRVVRAGPEPGQQPGRPGIGRVEVTAEYHDGDTPGPGQLEGGRGRLSAGARYPGVVDQEDVGSSHCPFGIKALNIQVTTLTAWPHGQPGDRQAQVR